MVRRLLAASVALVILAGAGTDLAACGDKFLRIGRSTRVKTYAVMYPASILFYVPAGAKPSAVKEFETILSRAGHRAQSVRSVDALTTALSTNEYDLVIASLADAERVKPHVQSTRSKPDVLPIVGALQKDARAKIDRDFRHVLEAESLRRDLLPEIDHTMKERRVGRP